MKTDRVKKKKLATLKKITFLFSYKEWPEDAWQGKTSSLAYKQRIRQGYKLYTYYSKF